MKTIILPGYSLSNREWAEEVKKKLGDKNKAFIHEWKHWITGEQKDFSVEDEGKKILSEVESSNVNIIAKSIGTLVAVTLLDRIAPQINKLILCGIPKAFIKDNKLDDKSYFGLKKLSSHKAIVFQNERDPLASYEEVRKMFSKIDPQIKVIKKDREDHSYPYYSDFEKILSG